MQRTKWWGMAMAAAVLVAAPSLAGSPWNPQQIAKLTPPPATWSFVLCGDSRDGDGVFEKILAQAKGHGDRFVINSGDLVPSGTLPQYKVFFGILQKAGLPVFTVVGNHDIKNGGRAHYNALLGPNYYAFDYGGDYHR